MSKNALRHAVEQAALVEDEDTVCRNCCDAVVAAIEPIIEMKIAPHMDAAVRRGKILKRIWVLVASKMDIGGHVHADMPEMLERYIDHLSTRGVRNK